MASSQTTELGLNKPTPGTREPVNVATQLDNNWDTLDAQFNNSTGHDHSGAHKGPQIPTGGLLNGAVTQAKISEPLTLSSPRLLTPLIDGNAAGSFGPYTSWTPAFTQGGTNPAATNISSRWSQMGKRVHVTGNLIVTGSGTSSQRILISTLPAPTAYAGGDPVIGTFRYVQIGVGMHAGVVVAINVSTIAFMVGGTQADYLGIAPACVQAAGDVLGFNLQYETP